MATVRSRVKQESWPSSPSSRQYYMRQDGFNADNSSERKRVLAPYTRFECQRIPVSPTPWGPYVIDAISDPGVSRIIEGDDVLRNRAYARFRQAALGDASSLGVAAAEWRESLGMINNRALGLYRSYKALRHGDFQNALKELSVSPKKKHRNKRRAASHEASGLWLEYWFGWKPFVSDIYGAADSLCDVIPAQKFQGTARGPFYQSSGSPGSYFEESYGTIKASTGAIVKITNYNQFLLSQLGVTNPATVAWELIPFSFLVDWVFKVGNFLESFTDFVGCSLENPYNTNSGRYYTSNSEPFGGRTYGSGFAVSRQHGIIRPVPTWNADSGMSTFRTRAATAVSLLSQILGSK